MKKLIIGMSGSSGPIYGIRLLEVLKSISEVETHLVMSPYAKLNIEIETSHKARYVESLADVVHSYRNQAASISSGSFKTDGMVVAPCSMKTLSASASCFMKRPSWARSSPRLCRHSTASLKPLTSW